jgi:hypothetical protein
MVEERNLGIRSGVVFQTFARIGLATSPNWNEAFQLKEWN